jgi:NUMOD3 motif
MFTHTQLKRKFYSQKWHSQRRGIEWQFTLDEWINWWGDDIYLRGNKKGQLVMARFGDTGPYHLDNVKKITCSDNTSEAHTAKRVSQDTRKKLSLSRSGKPGPNLGKTFSAETLEKMSQAAAARRSPRVTLRKAVITPYGEFESLMSASKGLNIHPATLSYRLKKFPTQYYLKGA